MRPILAAFVLLVSVRSTSQPISPTTAAMYHSQYTDDGEVLDLLVLLRGAPGWFDPAIASGVVGSATSGTTAATFGGKTFSIDLNLTSRTAHLLDLDISLKDANLVLFDDADTVAPELVEARWVDPDLGKDVVDPIATLIRRSPGVYDFLRCEIQLPDDPGVAPAINQAKRQVFALLCARMRGQ